VGRSLRFRRWLSEKAPTAVCAFGEFAVAHTALALAGRRVRPRFLAMLRRSALRLSGLRRVFVERALRTADLVCANSEAGRSYGIRELGIAEDRIALLGNVLDPSLQVAGRDHEATRRALGLDGTAPTVVYVGRNAYAKDTPTLCRALARLAKGVPAVQIVVLGESLDRLPAGCADPGPEVRWLGARPDAAQIIAAADVLLLTSRSEGTPNVVLEAMALGTPVVSTAVGDVPRLLAGGAGIVTPVGDDRALAEAVARLLSDPEMRRAMASSALARVSREFGLEEVVDRLVSLLDAVPADSRSIA
jgi:glycosyltransferase involved in cell wall biosynthesis